MWDIERERHLPLGGFSIYGADEAGDAVNRGSVTTLALLVEVRQSLNDECHAGGIARQARGL